MMNDLADDQIIIGTPNPEGSVSTPRQRDWGALRDVNFRLTLEVGRTRLTVRELLAIREGSLIATTRLSGEPMDLSLDSDIFSRAEVTVINDKLWARLTKIVGGQL
jgi:flagellar motor switch protein FliN/FliY